MWTDPKGGWLGRGRRPRKKVRDTEGRERPREKGSETQRDKERIR